MAFEPFTLRYADISALDKLGLRLAGLRQTGQLLRGSRIEAPTSILSIVAPDAFLDVGAFCNLSGGTINNVRFGRYCSVATGVVIGAHEHPTDWLTTSRIAYYPEVNGWTDLVSATTRAKVSAGLRVFADTCPNTTIGPDVWIGQGAFIKAGVTIGAGAIIGARTTVLRDVPPYAIVVGTPGRVVRLRFPEATVERLMAVEWWRYSLYELVRRPDGFDRCSAGGDREPRREWGRVALCRPRHRARSEGSAGPRRGARAGGHGPGQLTGILIRSRSGPTAQPSLSGIRTR